MAAGTDPRTPDLHTPPPRRLVPGPDPLAAPAGFVVVVEPQERIHFLDWTPPDGLPDGHDHAPVLLIHGLAGTAHVWAPIARRLCAARRIVAMDLRGHGLSDAPTDGYRLATLGADGVAVAEGAGLLDAPGSRVILAGHGFGAMVALASARLLGDRCAGLVLVDGGWEDVASASGMDVEEFLRTLDEPPEVMRSVAAYIDDRAAFDPATWDADQEAAARAAIVELPAGRVVSSTRPHVVEACVRAMFEHRPFEALLAVDAPVRVLAGAEDEAGGRTAALERLAGALAEAGHPLASRTAFPRVGHNLMRYRPDEVALSILDAGDRGTGRP